MNRYRIIHGVKTAIGCVIGVCIEKYYDLPQGQWIPITVMVVMSAQTHFGGALRKAYMRFLGTAAGIAVTIAALCFFGNNIWVIAITVFVAIIVFAYVASSDGDINYAGTLGGTTMLLTLAGQQSSVFIALQRGGYIVTGIVIALLISRFIFPIHARDRFRYHVAATLRNLNTLYQTTVQLNTDSHLSDIISYDLSSDQPRLIKEAVTGSKYFAINEGFFTGIVNSEHQLNRLISLIYLSFTETNSAEAVQHHLQVVENIHIVIESSLLRLADCFENNTQPEVMINLDWAIDDISQVVEKTLKNDKTFKVITEYSFVFFIEQILKELENLRQLIAKVNSKNDNNVV